MKKTLPVIIVILLSSIVFAQQENVPIDNEVYTFLKEMKVKNIISGIHDDSPNMSRAEVLKFLDEIDTKSGSLSATEKSILKKYQNEFYDNLADSSNTFQFINSNTDFSNDYSDLFSDKIKYLYVFKKTGINFYFDMIGRLLVGQNFEPRLNNSELFDIGFRMHGTLFDKLGYSFTVQKGGISGSPGFAAILDPRMNYNFKFIENIENIGNYDFVDGYLRYHTEPIEDMNLDFQIGREKIKLGYGYGSKLVLSGDHPDLDFIRVNFRYGIFSFSSLSASTVGPFDPNRENDYTKYYAYNKIKVEFKNFADLGIGEAMIYSGRGIELAYLNPFAFYKFEEMSLQDRDNGTIFLDFQTNGIENLELQGTFFLDENILSHLQDMSLYSNKTAYQFGAFWYSPFSINDASVVLEYTKIRPYVYSHTNPQNSYTSFGQSLGHRIGPNADEIYSRLTYNFSSKLSGNFEFQHIRSGENIYDGQGNLIFNAGGDYRVPYRDGIDPLHINFLAGERINQNIYTLSLRYEPFRKIYFDLLYKIINQKNISKDISDNSSYAYIRMMLEF